ncbi:flagellar hook assembly protein FlgD [Paenalkalicoccus suaedae]|uniref:Flagellar hook assembly protein FlgD n=1 Tax=Paenalkalicoccus suaedae TaxID=2592382 RepID=A0A859FFP3_9BACI|nr:flagellar hook assembly protein FlgD [Paenalkalicoccus suaedae]QKS71434.1 flagellar hook assembly protein FlgD [Paenalkalicoccus suaedae]
MTIVSSSSNPIYFEEYKEQQKNQANSSTLDQDAFLKILLTQLSNQDPLNPMEDKEFIAQMAQFSSLEQMTQMNQSLKTFLEASSRSELASNAELIGKVISYERTNSSGEKTPQEGLVTSVVLKEGRTLVELEDGVRIPIQDIQAVKAKTE